VRVAHASLCRAPPAGGQSVGAGVAG
jgi:hypothetical protein